MLHRLLADEKGVSAAEYAMLLAVVGAALALAALALSKSISCSILESALIIEGAEGHPSKPRGQSDPNGEAKGHLKGCDQ
jgi:pilus assembly protein Flp/PilA